MRSATRRVMTFLMNIIKFLFKERIELAIFFTAFLVEIVFGLYLIYRWGHTFACGDAVSHLYIPRTVVDNGPYSNFANIGTVWLPMFHLLVMLLTLIDPLYTTGFAGTIVNALATGGICVLLYRLIGDKKLGIVASALFMGNAFTLIYGATAMMEQTAVFFMALAAYYFKRYWDKDDIVEFMNCSLALIFGTLTRYEVWAVAFLVITFFVLRELNNGQSYRVAYAHLPLWGIFAWLFWNLAIFRDPLAFIHHPLMMLRELPSSPLSIWDVVGLISQNLFAISGMLYFLALISMTVILVRKKFLQTVVSSILITPIPFIAWLSFLGFHSGWVRIYYMGLVGLLISSFYFARGFKKMLRITVVLVILIAYTIGPITETSPLTIGVVTASPRSDINFAATSRLKEEVSAIKEVISKQSVLMSSAPGTPGAHSYAYYSVFAASSPSLIIDDHDQELYLMAMKEPWKYCSYVVMEKTSADNPKINIINDYYQGRYFVYRYYADKTWRLEFLRHYELALETEHYLVFRLIGGT